MLLIIVNVISCQDDEYVVRLTENAPFDINAYLLPFAIVVGICFVIMLGEKNYRTASH